MNNWSDYAITCFSIHPTTIPASSPYLRPKQKRVLCRERPSNPPPHLSTAAHLINWCLSIDVCFIFAQILIRRHIACIELNWNEIILLIRIRYFLNMRSILYIFISCVYSIPSPGSVSSSSSSKMNREAGTPKWEAIDVFVFRRDCILWTLKNWLEISFLLQFVFASMDSFSSRLLLSLLLPGLQFILGIRLNCL